MFDLEGCIDYQLRAMDRPKPTLIFPEADDGRVLTAASLLVPFANIVLMTSKERVQGLLDQGVPLKGSARRLLDRVRIMDPANGEPGPEIRTQMAQQMAALSRGR